MLVRYASESDLVQQSIAPTDPLCKKPISYIPDASHINATPIRYVRVNFHIMQRNNGTGNFNEAEGREFCRKLVDESNIRWSNNEKMNLPENNTTDVLPTQIRIVLQKDSITGQDAIYFHQDDSLCFWNRNAKKGGMSLSDRTVIDKYEQGEDSIINIFLIEHVPDSIGKPGYGEASLSGISFVGSLKLFSMYYQYTTIKYRDDGTPFKHEVDFLSKLLNHELGHSFGLAHTWNWDDGCDDTPKNKGCWSQKEDGPCAGVISNNMMDYNWSQHSVSPCQIGKMHATFSKEKDGTRKYAIPYWCDYHAYEKVIIYKYEQAKWEGGKDLWGDIEIREGATLEIKCEVSLPEKAKVIIKPGGKLILNGGTLTNRCGDKYDGIEIWENKKTGEKGQIIIANNGSVINAVNFATVQVTE